MKHFRSSFYLPAHRNRINHTYEENENGYLFAKGLYLTRIRRMYMDTSMGSTDISPRKESSISFIDPIT